MARYQGPEKENRVKIISSTNNDDLEKKVYNFVKNKSSNLKFVSYNEDRVMIIYEEFVMIRYE